MATVDEYIYSIRKGLALIESSPSSNEWLFVVKMVDDLLWNEINEDEYLMNALVPDP